MEDDEERRDLESMVKADLYPLAYNGVTKTNPDPGCDLQLFERGSLVAAEVQIHSHSFAATKKKDAAIGYSFRLQSVYLVEDQKEEVATPRKRKPGLFQMVSNLCRYSSMTRTKFSTKSIGPQSTKRNRGSKLLKDAPYAIQVDERFQQVLPFYNLKRFSHFSKVQQ